MENEIDKHHVQVPNDMTEQKNIVENCKKIIRNIATVQKRNKDNYVEILKKHVKEQIAMHRILTDDDDQIIEFM